MSYDSRFVGLGKWQVPSARAYEGRCYNDYARAFVGMFTRLAGEVAQWLKAPVC